MKKVILSIGGMTCSACSSGLEKYLNKQVGIKSANVNLVMANASIEYDEKKLNLSQIEQFVKQAGFKSLGEFKEIKIESKNKKVKILFLIYTVLAIILMYISMGHMIKLPVISIFNPHENPIIYTVSLFLLSIAFVIYGYDILKNGYRNLIHRTPNMDTLVSVGVISSLIYSLYNMYKVLLGNYSFVMNLYFESAAIVVYFIKLGRYIDGLSKDKTKEAISKLVQITPNKATKLIDGKEQEVTLDEISKGDILVLKPGEKTAVDGKIVLGKAHFDEAFITGESRPVAKQEGNKILAGSINYDGYIQYKAERIGKESTISEIVKLVLEASNTKAPISKLADKASGIFVPVVFLIAIVSFILYMLITKDFNLSLTTFVTILVVACPCSLGLATPLAMVEAEGICTENGILVKKNEILEKAKNINTIVFDKTGTLTYGKLKISKINNYTQMKEEELLQIVGSIESESTHPIGKAFTDYMQEKKIEKLDVECFQNIAGMGIKAKIQENEILIGNSKMLCKFGITNNYEQDEKIITEEGNTIIYVVKNNEIISLIGVNDIVRKNAKEVIDYLNKNNIQTIMLTGDNEKTAKKIAIDLGINKVISNVMPNEKVKVIKELKEKEKIVMMCGDGINDSPALANADIGLSINTATDIAMDSADVILTSNDLTGIIKLIKISSKTIKNIKQNLFWAFFYNFLMIPIAIGVLKPIGISINPMIASLAMVFSSITVILNALRLRKIKF